MILNVVRGTMEGAYNQGRVPNTSKLVTQQKSMLMVFSLIVLLKKFPELEI